MIAFRKGWEPAPHITEKMAKDLLKALLNPSAPNFFSNPVPPPPSAQSLHIAEFINELLYNDGYKYLEIQITRDENNNLIFKIKNKGK